MAKAKKKKQKIISSPVAPRTSGEPGNLVTTRVPWKFAILIVLVSVAVFSNTLSMEFIWDDHSQVLNDQKIRRLGNIPSMFTSNVWGGVKGEYQTPYYRPLFSVSLASDYAIWGESPFGYHLTNILLHAASSVMVFLIGLRLFKGTIPALFASIIFAVHPVHVEAVTWISARNESLCALFMFASFYCYLLYKEEKKAHYIAVSLMMFFSALLSKEMAVTFPGLILVYELCFGEGSLKDKVKQPIVFCLLIIPYFVLRLIFLERGTFISAPLPVRFLTSAGIIVEYLRLLILPINLKVIYHIPLQKIFSVREVLVPFAVLAGVIAGLVMLWKYEKRLFFCLSWIFITLFPISGLPVILLPVPMAERYLYIPSAGFALAIGALFSSIMVKKGAGTVSQGTPGGVIDQIRPVFIPVALGVALSIILSLMTFQRNYVWSDDYSIGKAMIKDAPYFAVGYSHLGSVYKKQGKLDQAIGYFMNAIKLNPNLPESYNNLGLVYIELGRFDDAIGQFQKALSINPKDPEVHINLAGAYIGLMKFSDAERELTEILRLRPDEPDAHYNLGFVYLQMNRIDEAIVQFERGLRLKPDDSELKKALAKAYEMKKGKP